MKISFMPKQPTDPLQWLCLKCKHTFTAPMLPGLFGLLTGKKIVSSGCPKCGSKKIVPVPDPRCW